MTTSYETIPVPGYTSPTATYTDPEILYSTNGGFTQKGVTLGSGQGILLAGTVLGQRTADKRYYVYNNAATDGTQTAVGVLRKNADTSKGDVQGNIVITGILKYNMVSGADSAALVDLGAVVDSVRNTFKF